MFVLKVANYRLNKAGTSGAARCRRDSQHRRSEFARKSSKYNNLRKNPPPEFAAFCLISQLILRFSRTTTSTATHSAQGAA
jgi:hypothetical protein